jgi:hypothetical protein
MSRFCIFELQNSENDVGSYGIILNVLGRGLSTKWAIRQSYTEVSIFNARLALSKWYLTYKQKRDDC